MALLYKPIGNTLIQLIALIVEFSDYILEVLTNFGMSRTQADDVISIPEVQLISEGSIKGRSM